MTAANDFTQLLQSIEAKSSFAIAIPPNPSIDAVCAATSLYLILSKMGKRASIVCSDEVKNDLNLFGAEKIGKKFVSDGDVLEVVIPYKDGIEDVNYRTEGDDLVLVVVPTQGAKRVDFSKIKYEYTGGKSDMVIVLDCARIESLGALHTDFKEQFQDTEIVNIDRKFNNSGFGTINIIDQKAASLSEMVYAFMQSAKQALDPELATNLYTGIVYATNNFTAYAVNAGTLEVAALLLRSGAQKRPYVPRQPLGGMPGGFPPTGDMPFRMPFGQPGGSMPGGAGMPPALGGAPRMPFGGDPMFDDDFEDDDLYDLPLPTSLPPVQPAPTVASMPQQTRIMPDAPVAAPEVPTVESVMSQVQEVPVVPNTVTPPMNQMQQPIQQVVPPTFTQAFQEAQPAQNPIEPPASMDAQLSQVQQVSEMPSAEPQQQQAAPIMQPVENTPAEVIENNDQQNDDAPEDWLKPKIFKGGDSSMRNG